MKSLTLLTLIGASLVIISGCRKEPEVKTYRLAQAEDEHAGHDHGPMDQASGEMPEGHPPMPQATGELPQGHPPIDGNAPMVATPGLAPAAQDMNYVWQAPEEWASKAASSMRIASYAVPGDGGDADFSLVRLAGAAGGLVGNVNRWRGQIALPPASAGEIEESVVAVPTALGVDAKVVEMSNNDQMIMSAIIEHEGGVLFVKLQGPSATVTAAREGYRQFISSIDAASSVEAP